MAPAKVEKTLPTVLPENFASWDGDLAEIPAVLPDDFEDFDDVVPEKEQPVADEPVVKEKSSAPPAAVKPVEQKPVERVVKAKMPVPSAPVKKAPSKVEEEFKRPAEKKNVEKTAREEASPILQSKSRQVIAEEDEPKSSAKGKIILGSVAAVVVLGASIGFLQHRSSTAEHPQVSIATTSGQSGTTAEDKPSPAKPGDNSTNANQAPQTPQQQQEQQQQQQADAAKGRTVNNDLTKGAPSRINASKMGGNQEPAPIGQIAMEDNSYRGNAGMFGNNKAKVNLGGGPSRVSVPTGTALGYLQKRVVPDYPAIARSARISGQVSVRIAVNKNGSVEDAHAFSGPMVFYESAEQAVRKWKFNAYKVNNQPVTMDTVVTLVFELK